MVVKHTQYSPQFATLNSGEWKTIFGNIFFFLGGGAVTNGCYKPTSFSLFCLLNQTFHFPEIRKKRSFICRCTLYSLGSRGERNLGKRKGRATPGEGEEGEGEGGEKDEEGTTRT